jgi:hypothetical protein
MSCFLVGVFTEDICVYLMFGGKEGVVLEPRLVDLFGHARACGT